MDTLEGRRVVVVGGSRGLGLGIVEAAVARKARVTVVARDAGRLAEVRRRLGVEVVAGDAGERELARSVLREARPSALIVTAGGMPAMAPLLEQSWEDFAAVWSSDVKPCLIWVQEALKLPLDRGSRVLLGSSGAAIKGSPLSGGYAGAKRMVWLLAHYANDAGAPLGLRFQALVPTQLVGETEMGQAAAESYARRKGVTAEQLLAGFGKPLLLRDVGEHAAAILTEPRYEGGVAFGLSGDRGITPLEG